jgi:hypothetical protein
VFLAGHFVDPQSRFRWSSFSVLLYLAGGGFGFLATQNHVFQVSRLAFSGDVSLDFSAAYRLTEFFNLIDISCNASFDILAAEWLVASFNLIDLSCDVSFEIRRFVASFICCNLQSRSWTVSRAFRFSLSNLFAFLKAFSTF